MVIDSVITTVLALIVIGLVCWITADKLVNWLTKGKEKNDDDVQG